MGDGFNTQIIEGEDQVRFSRKGSGPEWGKLDLAGGYFSGVLPGASVGAPARLAATGTTVHTGDWALSGGFGSTASVAVAGTGQRGKVTISSAGTGQGANPTATLTFPGGAWPSAPFAVVARNGGDQPTVVATWVESTTTLVLTFVGTPVAGESYTFEWILLG